MQLMLWDSSHDDALAGLRAEKLIWSVLFLREARWAPVSGVQKHQHRYAEQVYERDAWAAMVREGAIAEPNQACNCALKISKVAKSGVFFSSLY